MDTDCYLTVFLEDKNIQDIRRLTFDEYQKFKNSSRFLYKLDTKLYFYYMINFSHNELIKYKKDINGKINNKGLLIDEREILFEFYRLLHNYLSSVHLFLNQYSANISRDYGKKFFREFEELRRDLYSSNVSYRIIYNLRNELVHSRLIDFEIKAKRKNMFEFELGIYLKKEFLLNIPKLKKDEEIKNFDDITDLFEHMENMNLYLMVLVKKIINYELKNHKEYYNFLKNLVEEVEFNCKLAITKKRKFNKKGFNQKMQFINVDLINFISQIQELKIDS